MFKRFTPSLIALTLASFPLTYAQTPKKAESSPEVLTNKVNQEKEKKVLDKLTKDLSLKVKEVVYFPTVDIYEAIIDGIYTPTFTTEKVNFLFNNGEVIDVANKTNLTKRTNKAKDPKYAEKEKAFLQKLKTNYSELGFVDATYLPTVELFELTHVNKDISTMTYAPENLSYIFNGGALLDLQGKQNLSLINNSKRKAPILVADKFKSLPLDTAIKMTYGKPGVRSIAVFSDPRCPWCKRMDTDIMLNLKDVDLDIYYFMNPLNIAGHEDAPEIASKILCSEDKVEAWKKWMLVGRIPEVNGEQCMPTVINHTNISIEREYNSTPTILTDTGYTLHNGVPSSRMAEFLKATEYINQPEVIQQQKAMGSE